MSEATQGDQDEHDQNDRRLIEHESVKPETHEHSGEKINQH